MKFTKDTWSKIGMVIFIIAILLVVSISGLVYTANTSNIEVKIQTVNDVNKEKTAVNEALTKTLVMKNDTIGELKDVIIEKDSTITAGNKVTQANEKTIKSLEHKVDSLNLLIRKFKPSDIEPVSKPSH